MTAPREGLWATVQTVDEAEETTLHAANLYAAQHGVRFSEALVLIAEEMDRRGRTQGALAGVAYMLEITDQCLPPEHEAPALHRGVEKLRATVRIAAAHLR